jgi:hypothetical protein
MDAHFHLCTGRSNCLVKTYIARPSCTPEDGQLGIDVYYVCVCVCVCTIKRRGNDESCTRAEMNAESHVKEGDNYLL